MYFVNNDTCVDCIIFYVYECLCIFSQLQNKDKIPPKLKIYEYIFIFNHRDRNNYHTRLMMHSFLLSYRKKMVDTSTKIGKFDVL